VLELLDWAGELRAAVRAGLCVSRCSQTQTIDQSPSTERARCTAPPPLPSSARSIAVRGSWADSPDQVHSGVRVWICRSRNARRQPAVGMTVTKAPAGAIEYETCSRTTQSFESAQ